MYLDLFHLLIEIIVLYILLKICQVVSPIFFLYVCDEDDAYTRTSLHKNFEIKRETEKSKKNVHYTVKWSWVCVICMR